MYFDLRFYIQLTFLGKYHSVQRRKKLTNFQETLGGTKELKNITTFQETLGETKELKNITTFQETLGGTKELKA